MNQNFNQQGQRAMNGGVPERVPLKLDVEPMEFDGLLKAKMTTTVALAKSVNRLFRPALSDYEGCIILPNQFGQLELTLWFKDKGNPIDGSAKALMPTNQINRQQSSVNDKIRAMNARNRQKSYELTQDAKDVLGEFIWVKQGHNIDWNQHVLEQTQQNLGNYTIYVKIVGIDILRILRKIYGKKKDNSIVEYNISIIRPVGVDFGYNSQNFLINILQLDVKEVEKIASEIGFIPANGQIPMIR